MKKTVLLTLIPVLMATSLPSQAAGSATINIKGSIVPTSCSLTVTGSADYGELHSTEVSKGDEAGFPLPQKRIPVAINCGASIPVAISLQADEITSTASSIHLPIIGNITEANKHKSGVLGTKGGKPIGYYAFGIDPGTFAAATGMIAHSPDGGNTWLPQNWANEHSIALDSSEWMGHPEIPITNANLTLILNASLDATVAVSATDTIDFDTNTTISLRYI